MKKLPWLLLLLTTVTVMSGCISVSANSGAPAAGAATAVNEVEALERARFKALIAVDLDALRPMLGEDLLYCHSSGVCQNRQEFFGFLSENRYLTMDIIYMKPRLVDGAAVINGRLNMRVDSAGKVLEFQAIYTDVYAKRDGRWQLVSWQSTRLP